MAMNEQDRQAPTADGAKRKVGGYLFLPRLMQRGAVILWLRRMHAWTGVYGALIFLLLGISGFYLHHRAEMKIENGRLREAASLTAFVEPGAIESEDDLAAWLTREYKVEGKRAPARGRPGEKVSFSGQQAEQPQLIEISFRAPNGTVSAEHAVGSNVVALKRQSASPLKAVIDMHKTVGVSTAFILIMDTIAGAMVFMSVSGVLLWTRLHGSRLAAVGLFSVATIASLIAMSGVWVSWSAP